MIDWFFGMEWISANMKYNIYYDSIEWLLVGRNFCILSRQIGDKAKLSLDRDMSYLVFFHLALCNILWFVPYHTSVLIEKSVEWGVSSATLIDIIEKEPKII